MDAFVLSLSYGIYKISFKKVIITSVIVGSFHYIMPFLGNITGIALFKYTIIRPKIILFLIFLILSIDMFLSFFEKEKKLRNLNMLGIIFFAISVSFDSFSVGLTLNYLCDNTIFACFLFSLISFLFTMVGFWLGKKISSRIGKYSFLFGSFILFLYSLLVC